MGSAVCACVEGVIGSAGERTFPAFLCEVEGQWVAHVYVGAVRMGIR